VVLVFVKGSPNSFGPVSFVLCKRHSDVERRASASLLSVIFLDACSLSFVISRVSKS